MASCRICIYDDGFSINGTTDALAHVRNLFIHYGWTRYMYPSKYIPTRIFIDTDNIKLLYCTIKYLNERKINVSIA